MRREDYPDPQFYREDCVCLDGQWEFEAGDCREKINMPLSGKIAVPFCPESELSGVRHTGFMRECAYSRVIKLTKKDLSGRLALRFGAVNYRADVYVNGKFAMSHEGGYTPFSADIAPLVSEGFNRITLLVKNDLAANVPSGKQSMELESHGCFYTRVTGIWQSVWLERTPAEYILSVRFFPDIKLQKVVAEVRTHGGGKVKIGVSYEGRDMGSSETDCLYLCRAEIPLAEKHLWEAGAGRLYDVCITFGKDRVYSYFGLREAKVKDGKFYLNGKSVFQRFVMDQGYYGEGVYTPASPVKFKEDIERGMKLGFNGARLHQKLSDPRLLYECDRLGYLVWEEYASWGMHYYDMSGFGTFIGEWLEAMERDFNHPSIVTWCPLNETWTDFEHEERCRDIRFPESVYAVTRLFDPTRPCVDVSGGYHGRFTDVFDYHTYCDADILRSQLKDLTEKNLLTPYGLYPPEGWNDRVDYDGKTAVILSEYGGMSLKDGSGRGWGYRVMDSEESFISSYERLTKEILECGRLCGFCFTQLYDVEQEKNGIFAYDRSPKFSERAMKRIAAANSEKAAVEE